MFALGAISTGRRRRAMGRSINAAVDGASVYDDEEGEISIPYARKPAS